MKKIKSFFYKRKVTKLASALLPILLLDEATSALDNENEQIINRSINSFANDKTVITIAHRLSTLNNCDHIIFIKDGEIIEQGSHQDLISLDGYYKKMYEVEKLQI